MTTASSPRSTLVGRCGRCRDTLSSQVIELTTNRRQAQFDQEWERQALVQLRNGDIAAAVAAYDAHDRIWSPRNRRRPSPADRPVVGHPCRGHHGHLGCHPRRRGRPERPGPRTAAQAGELGEEIRLASGKAFAVGDRILFEKNARAHLAHPARGAGRATVAIRNGTFATVVAVPGQTGPAGRRPGKVTSPGSR